MFIILLYYYNNVTVYIYSEADEGNIFHFYIQIIQQKCLAERIDTVYDYDKIICLC